MYNQFTQKNLSKVNVGPVNKWLGVFAVAKVISLLNGNYSCASYNCLISLFVESLS